MTNIALSPTGKRVVVEARGEIFTIPAEKGDVRNLTNSSASAERDPAWSPDGKSISYFSDKSGEYTLVIASRTASRRRARSSFRRRPLLHGVVVARLEEDPVPRHEPQVWVRGRRERQGEGRRQRSVDGADAHDEPGVEPRLEVDRVLGAPQLALSRDLRRATSRPARRSRSPTASPTPCRRRGMRAASTSGSSRRPTSGCCRSGST